YAESLPLDRVAAVDPPDAEARVAGAPREQLAALWLTLDAINFGSGWFPTLRKPPGHTGYFTIAGGLRRRFDEAGPWSADELAHIDRATIAAAVGQGPEHEL